jgi:hypothetical protein
MHNTQTTITKTLAHKEITRSKKHSGPNPAAFDAKMTK